jgi:hypothetical protein
VILPANDSADSLLNERQSPLGGSGLIGIKGVLIRLKVGEGDVLFYIDRKVNRKQISGLLLFIDPNDKKNS